MTGWDRCAASQQFGAATARRDLRRFQRRGPDVQTRHILAAASGTSMPAGPTLLDIGGGIGAIHHVLLDNGFSHATHVDASDSYLAAAREESRRRGHADNVSFLLADFPARLRESRRLISSRWTAWCAATGIMCISLRRRLGARWVLAFSYPRARWIVRLYVATYDAFSRVRGRAFRTFVHPPEKMRAVLEAAGMQSAWAGGNWIWAVELFDRVA